MPEKELSKNIYRIIFKINFKKSIHWYSMCYAEHFILQYLFDDKTHLNRNRT